MSAKSSERYGKPRKGTQSKGSDGFKGFVTIELTSQDRETIDESYQAKQVDLWGFICDAVGDGYKFSLVADFTHSCCIATLTGRGKENENEGYALSARGPDPDGATLVLWYKHTVLAHLGSWIAQGAAPDQQLRMFD